MMMFEFSDFSKYRIQLMGVSIVAVMLFHAFGRYSLFAWGTVGVEFFLVISAIGLYFSLSRDQRLLPFYGRRLMRILPAYLIVAIIYYLLMDWGNLDWSRFLYNISGLCILEGRLDFWFIGLILVCYLVAPFYYRLMKYKYSILLPFVMLVVCFALGLRFVSLEIVLNRFAIFFMGLHLARWVHEKKRIQVPHLWLLCLVAFLMIVVVNQVDCYVGFRRVAGFILSIPVLMGCILLLKKASRPVHVGLIFMGAMSLELYMIHERICLYMLLGQMDYNIRGIISFPIAILLAYLLHKALGLALGNVGAKR
ncbi:MAG: acyltransferase [Muribaculaceae bacterium]|nr:acyltransferase [Muribaculaceae bacterium]